MSFKIVFALGSEENKSDIAECSVTAQPTMPHRSVVQICFVHKDKSLAYYNDQFDLHIGDIVYVEGKLEGIPGRVVDVNYNFKIKLSDYRRVIALVDTTVHGQFFMAGSNFITFSRETLPCSQASLWFNAPLKEGDEYVSGNDDTSFCLDNPTGFKLNSGIMERGNEYYLENRVKYICLDDGKGYAVVEGGKNYEVEFAYSKGEISRLVCVCYCNYNCKHQVAVMLQLREILELIEKNYSAEYERTGYFAAINKCTLFSYAVDSKEKGTFTL